MIEMSVVIPHHRDEESLLTLLLSLRSQETSFQYEVIVISNPPSKKAQKVVSDFSNTRNIQCKMTGANLARNIGIINSSAPLILFLDSDCETANAKFLQQHRDLHHKHSAACCIGGTYKINGLRIPDIAYNYSQMKWLSEGAQIKNRCRFLIGGNFSCKRHLLDGLLFDENIIYGGSETEFFLRLNGGGNKIFLLFPELAVFHNTKLNAVDFIQKFYRQGAGTFYIEEKLNAVLRTDIRPPLAFDQSKKNDAINFWILLSQWAFNLGYQNRNYCPQYKALGIYLFFTGNYYRLWLSAFFENLETLLRNFPRA